MFFKQHVQRVAALGFAASLLLPARPAQTQTLPETAAVDGRRFYPDDPLWTDHDSIDTPKPKKFPSWHEYDFIENTFRDPGKSDGPSLNVNTLDEVPDSSWFTNRIGQHEMSVDEVVYGLQAAGPAPGPWLVTGRPSTGITPKFTIKDSRGQKFLIKLDPAHMPELVSSAEVISTKIFHAIGYYVAEAATVGIDFDNIKIDKDAKFSYEGKRVRIRKSHLKHWLANLPRTADGTVRAVSSKYISGKYVGEFRHYGTRSDDPNDIFPHERRRELRGYRVFCAWLNHDDSRSLNTFDSYVEVDGRSFIRHHLLDFGSNLGSGSTTPQAPRAGNEYLFEGGTALKGIFSLGLWARDWMKFEYPDYPAVGNFEADGFDPKKWRPEYPNAAFARMDAADAFWAARIVSKFSDEMVTAIVGEAKITDPKAEAYLTQVLIKRRDKVVNYWIARTNPLDEFTLRRAPDSTHLSFDNAAIRVGAASDAASYHIQWSRLDNLANQEKPVGSETQLKGTSTRVPEQAWGPPDDTGARYAVGSIRTEHADFPHWQQPVRVSLRDHQGELKVVGIERPREDAYRLP